MGLAVGGSVGVCQYVRRCRVVEIGRSVGVRGCATMVFLSWKNSKMSGLRWALKCPVAYVSGSVLFGREMVLWDANLAAFDGCRCDCRDLVLRALVPGPA